MARGVYALTHMPATLVRKTDKNGRVYWLKDGKRVPAPISKGTDKALRSSPKPTPVRRSTRRSAKPAAGGGAPSRPPVTPKSGTADRKKEVAAEKRRKATAEKRMLEKSIAEQERNARRRTPAERAEAEATDRAVTQARKDLQVLMDTLMTSIEWTLS